MTESRQPDARKRDALSLRLAAADDIPAIRILQQRAIDKLQEGFLSPAQIRASHAAMGLDTQLITDGTYFCVLDAASGAIAGCGGWSRRATLYGGNHSAGRDARLLVPAIEPARIRAMYTDPAHVRRGIGRMILRASEAAARAEGFRNLSMAATEAGKPFYLSCGYSVARAFEDKNGGTPVPLYEMIKSFAAPD